MAKKNFIYRTWERIEWRTAIKAGIASGLSLFLGVGFSHLLQRPDSLVSGMWCVMSSIIVVLQSYLGETHRAAWVRFLGVLFGSLMGAIFTIYFGSGAISLGLSVCGTILLCSIFGIKESVRIASLSVAVVMILWGIRPSITPWIFALYRFLDSCLGILIAVFVAHVIWPEKAIDNLKKNVAKTFLAMSKLYRFATDFEEDIQRTGSASKDLELEIDKMLDDNRNFHEVSKLELLKQIENLEQLALVIEHQEVIFKAILNLKKIYKSNLAKIFDDALGNQVAEVIDKSDLAFQELAKRVESNQKANLGNLKLALDKLNEEQMRFRKTHTTRKFNLEEVENFFLFFYCLRLIGEALIKSDEILR